MQNMWQLLDIIITGLFVCLFCFVFFFCTSMSIPCLVQNMLHLFIEQCIMELLTYLLWHRTPSLKGDIRQKNWITASSLYPYSTSIVHLLSIPIHTIDWESFGIFNCYRMPVMDDPFVICSLLHDEMNGCIGKRVILQWDVK